jgi:hypothetical protein
MPDVLYSHLTIGQEKSRAIWRISREAVATRNVCLYPQLAVPLSRANYVCTRFTEHFPIKHIKNTSPQSFITLTTQLQAIRSIRMYTLLLQENLGGFVKFKVFARTFNPAEQFQSRTVPLPTRKILLTLLTFVRAHLGIRHIFVAAGLTINTECKFCISIGTLGI